MSTGHIRKRPTKDGKPSYQLIVESEKDPITGKRQRFYKTVNGTKKEAEVTLTRMKAEIDGSGAIAKPSALKLSDWMAEWLELYLPNIEATTRANYVERITTKLNPYLGSTPLKNIQTSMVQQWVNDLSKKENLAPKSVKNVYLNLKAALDKAVLLNMIPQNPCTGVELPKLVKYQAEVYDDIEIEKLLQETKGTDMYLFIVLEISLGLRRGEIAALEWSDIDFEKSVIHITKNRVIAGKEKITKSPKSQAGIRDLYIGEQLHALLSEEYKRYQADKNAMGGDFVDSNLVIRQKNGKGFSPDSLTQKWIRFRKDHGLKEIRLHDLRHTCATAMLSAGVSPKVIQTRLGHSDISVTMNIYTHSLPSMNKDAGDKIDEVLFR